MLLLLAHELGHYFAFRAYGLPARLPAFVPLLGAFTAGAPPEDLEQDAYIALAGPLVGLGLAAVCYAIGDATQDRFWYACADLSAFLNLFNMIPMPPFDGGRIIGALWPPLWIVGFALFVAFAIVMHIPVLFVVIIGVLGLPAMLAAWRGHVDPRAERMTFGRARPCQPLVSRDALGPLLRDGPIARHCFAARSRKRRLVMRRWLLALACASIAVAILAARPRPTPGPFLRDFEAYWAAGSAWNAHGDPYGRAIWTAERAVAGVDARHDEVLPFVGPPATLLAWTSVRAFAVRCRCVGLVCAACRVASRAGRGHDARQRKAGRILFVFGAPGARAGLWARDQRPRTRTARSAGIPRSDARRPHRRAFARRRERGGMPRFRSAERLARPRFSN